jgi:hypothetical protein
VLNPNTVRKLSLGEIPVSVTNPHLQNPPVISILSNPCTHHLVFAVNHFNLLVKTHQHPAMNFRRTVSRSLRRIGCQMLMCWPALQARNLSRPVVATVFFSSRKAQHLASFYVPLAVEAFVVGGSIVCWPGYRKSPKSHCTPVHPAPTMINEALWACASSDLLAWLKYTAFGRPKTANGRFISSFFHRKGKHLYEQA